MKKLNYYTLNAATHSKAGHPTGIIVEARDRASAANKIQKEWKIAVSGSNLRKVLGEGKITRMLRSRTIRYQLGDVPAKYARIATI